MGTIELKQGHVGVELSTDRAAAIRFDANGRRSAGVIQDAWVLSDEILLQICCVSLETESVTAEWLASLRGTSALIGHARHGPDSHLRSALSLLASLLARLPHYQHTHLPCGYGGPQVRFSGWVDRDTLEQIGKQIVGFVWEDRLPEAVACAVETAVSQAIHVGFMQEKRYDAWRPGMPSGSGWRFALRATPYGEMKARALLGCTPPQGPAHAHRPPAVTGPIDDHTGVASPEDQSAVRADNQARARAGASLRSSVDVEAQGQTESPSPVPAVELGRPGEPCRVRGREKRPLTDAQHAVVSALLRAADAGLNKDGLEAIRSSARRILKHLRQDPDWAEVVVMPGQTNGRYRIRV